MVICSDRAVEWHTCNGTMSRMRKVGIASLLVCLAAAAALAQSDDSQLRFARQAERVGDSEGAAQLYTTIVSMLQAGPDFNKVPDMKLSGEPVSSIGRRMVYWQIRRLHDQIAKPQPTMELDVLQRDLQGAYGKMQSIEKYDPTWYYLDALGSAANGHYRQAYQLCRQAATAPGGEESVRQKARSLAQHIKPGADAQDKMREEDQAAYEEYVRSGRQALDFAIVSARCSADDARRRGDQASADMWESRYSDLNRQKNDQMQNNGGKWYP